MIRFILVLLGGSVVLMLAVVVGTILVGFIEGLLGVKNGRD